MRTFEKFEQSIQGWSEKCGECVFKELTQHALLLFLLMMAALTAGWMDLGKHKMADVNQTSLTEELNTFQSAHLIAYFLFQTFRNLSVPKQIFR